MARRLLIVLPLLLTGAFSCATERSVLPDALAAGYELIPEPIATDEDRARIADWFSETYMPVEKRDADGDGRITGTEYMDATLDRYFAFDADRDMRLSWPEYADVMCGFGWDYRHTPSGQACYELELSRFWTMDENRDRRLDRDEARERARISWSRARACVQEPNFPLAGC